MIYKDFLVARARKKHAVDFVTIRPVHHNLLSIERLHQNVPGLVQTAKNQVVKAQAAAPFLT